MSLSEPPRALTIPARGVSALRACRAAIDGQGRARDIALAALLLLIPLAGAIAVAGWLSEMVVRFPAALVTEEQLA